MEWLIGLAHWFGSAVCHQLPDNSYSIGGIQLPLCARCTGMYLGALVTLTWHSWRHPRAIRLPHSWIVVALPLFFLAWASDGVNSLLASIPVLPHLYPPQNILRLTTGTLMGITLGSLVFVMFNSLIWDKVNADPIIATPVELFSLLGLGALFVVAVQSGWGVFLIPMTMASLIAILVLNSALMSALAGSLLRPNAADWRKARRPITVGTCVALTVLDALAVFRLGLGAWLGAPV